MHSDSTSTAVQQRSDSSARIKDRPFAEMARSSAHFDAAPAAFLQAWKRAASLAGVGFFGNGTRQDLERATSKWDLRPDVEQISDVIGVLSSGEKLFIAALVSFYNAETGGQLLQRIGVRGLADLGGLDLERRHIIADLLLNYTGW